LEVDLLEDRTVPATFHPSPSPLVVPDGAPGSLRAAIIAANGNASTTNTFILRAGEYILSVPNTLGQENAAARGDLDLTARGKTYVFRGQGRAATVIDADLIDRVFQVFPNVRVEFHDLTIRGGLATDDGTTTAGPTDAHGGGILNDGGRVLLENVAVRNNQVVGSAGANGLPNQNGAPGGAARGGGVSSAGGSLTLRNGTRVVDNLAQGGLGGAGGQGTTDIRGGTGGAGGTAQGGGVYVDGSALTITNGAVADNQAGGGGGGRGGDGFTGASGFALQGGGGGRGGLAQGGGLYVDSNNFSLATSTVAGNTARGGVGGRGGDAGTNTSDNDDLTGGFGGSGGFAEGGGLYAVGGSLTVQRSTFSANQALGGAGARGGDGGQGGAGSPNAQLRGGFGGAGGWGLGGGVYVARGTLTTITTTVSGNAAGGGAGGRGGDGGTGTDEDGTTTVGPGGGGGDGGFGRGGGLYVSEGTLSLFNGTVAANRALASTGGTGGNGNGNGLAGFGGTGDGGGLHLERDEGVAGRVLSRSSLIGDNLATTAADVSGPIRAGASLIENVGGARIIPLSSPNVLGVDARLGPLANNGGPTQTHSLPAGSPALARGSNPLRLKVEQRGRPRIVGCTPDIGAFER
jgi:hypothetical protein